MPETIQLLPSQDAEFRPLFKSREEEEAFYRSFLEQVRPDLEKLRDAHQASEEQSRNCWVG